MTTITGFIKRHPVLSYYALTFAVSWGVLLLVIGGPGGIPGIPEQVERLMPIVIPVFLLGPSIAGIVMTGVIEGRAGYRALLARLLHWRVGLRWYAVALLTAPLVFAAVLLSLSLASPAYLPGLLTTSDAVSFLLTGLASALMVGVLEELGWTGFVIPRLLRRHGVVTVGLIVGVLWGAWHILPMDLWAAVFSTGSMPLGLYMAVNGVSFLVGQLPAFRVLMVWVYDRTGSLLLAMLMHTSLTASTFILNPIGLTGVPLLTFGFAEAAALWLVVAAVALASHGHLTRRSLRPQAA